MGQTELVICDQPIDITYVRLHRRVRLPGGGHGRVHAVDPRLALGRGLDQGLTLAALERGLVIGSPEIHHSDQGVQYAATAYVRTTCEASA